MLQPELIDPSDLPADNETLSHLFDNLMSFVASNGETDIDQDLRDIYDQNDAREYYSFLSDPDMTKFTLSALGRVNRLEELTADQDFIESQGLEYWKNKGQSDKPSIKMMFITFDKGLLSRAGFPDNIRGVSMYSTDGRENPSEDMNRRLVVNFHHNDDLDLPESIFPTIEHRVSFWDTKDWMKDEQGNNTSYLRDYSDRRLGNLLDDVGEGLDFFERVKSFNEVTRLLQEHKIKNQEVQWLNGLVSQYPALTKNKLPS